MVAAQREDKDKWYSLDGRSVLNRRIVKENRRRSRARDSLHETATVQRHDAADRDAILVRQQSSWTSASVTAGIDPALALVVRARCGTGTFQISRTRW